MIGLVWPNGTLEEPTCTDAYALRPWSAPGVRAFHTGDDAVGFSELRAIGAGVVVESHRIDWAGWQVLVDLGLIGGVRTWVRYCHLAERSALRQGDTVTLGALIGLMGMTGIAYGVHLHWEIYRGSVDRGGGTGSNDVGSTVDPRAFVRANLITKPEGQEEEVPMKAMYCTLKTGEQYVVIGSWGNGFKFTYTTRSTAFNNKMADLFGTGDFIAEDEDIVRRFEKSLDDLRCGK